MRFILGFLLFLAVSAAGAAPFVVGDVEPSVTDCRVILQGQDMGFVTAYQAANGQNTCAYDVANVANGQNTISMSARDNDPIWGPRESVQSNPLDFTKPGDPTAPGLRLVPVLP